ncbi:nucleotidyl transferase AbiEii/AbiGii toxin family protein [Salinibacterium sp. NK8237]|uniref:nucleotidyl transferase AbiEii/AbiGii toxin family protein n=1 Tax=Salinibacterium sp. NK8237 TaxID=2792038 RepID=UPI0018CD5B06|nr:nucleotidyl transferase AbiEii/AbiGii toxin family protein [Salinibacterium sp. NK8237]MBH0131418.1 nucleotidyl transferase AbiEii/AbiGii toxin family protein [Salinibacterium sp. NK8237]
MNGDEVFRRIQAAARASVAANGSPAPTQEYLIRHSLESFLDRLNRTVHAPDFVLKGGLLLGAYGVRRPTKDADSNAIAADVTPEHLSQVVRDVAAVDAGDGVEFLLDTLNIAEIRDDADYPGVRVRVQVTVSSWQGVVAWDVSAGDPIVPAPREVTLERILGNPIRLVGYAPESTVAEKGVTILERGIASTRWRDYVDIVTLSGAGLDAAELLKAVRAVAAYREVSLSPIAPILQGYGALSQPKWAAWRKKERLQDVCAEKLDDQIAQVAAILDPIFEQGSE